MKSFRILIVKHLLTQSQKFHLNVQKVFAMIQVVEIELTLKKESLQCQNVLSTAGN